MALWHLRRFGKVEFDEYDECVIRAPSEAAAREIAGTLDQGFEDPKLSSCDRLAADGVNEIVCSSYAAG